MTLGVRKVVVIALVGAVLLLGNVWLVVNWLQDHGVIDLAKHVRHEYLTGTAITIILVLLILLVGPGGVRAGLIKRCPVCEHVLLGRGQYCSECGSRA